MKIAVLITSFNRREKTFACLSSLYAQEGIENGFSLDTYLVDDGSTDGTNELVQLKFPQVTYIAGSGKLYWAGGMRMAWKNAIASNIKYKYFLLLNDDTIIEKNCIEMLLNDVSNLNNTGLILVGSTLDNVTGEISYGGRALFRPNHPKSRWVYPNNNFPQRCDLGNANVMLVSENVVAKIGILSEKYTHGIADYDYTLNAVKESLPVYVSSKYVGKCFNDHKKNWLSADSRLKDRINYLYDIKGLAYNEYCIFIKTHFPKYLLIARSKLWLKTLFPQLWDRLKNVEA